MKPKGRVKRIGTKDCLTRRTKLLLESMLAEDSFRVPDTQDTSLRQDVTPPDEVPLPDDTADISLPDDQDTVDLSPPDDVDTSSSDDVIPETQQTETQETDIFNVTLASDDDPSDESSLLLVDNNGPPTTGENGNVGSAIKTVISCRDNATPPVIKSVHLFRGPKNPLSAFYHQRLRWKKMNFISAEQAYQHEKMVFHRVSRAGRNRLLRCRSSHDVKRIANELVPNPSDCWDKIKFSLMTEIITNKLYQCKRFREALSKTNGARLIHNTETDSVWGCGIDLKGRNMMGNILMDVRDIIHTYQQEFPPLPSAPAPPPPTPTTDDRECTESPSTIVIGNSNTRGLASISRPDH